MNEFTMFNGESKLIECTITEEGSAADLSNSTIFWGFKDVVKKVGEGITLTDPTSGKFQIKLDPVDTENVTGTYSHECLIKDTQGNESVVFQGIIKVKKRLLTFEP